MRRATAVADRCRTPVPRARRQAWTGRPTGQHHRALRLLQFKSEGAHGCHRYSGRHARPAPHRRCRGDADLAPPASNCTVIADATWQTKKLDFLLGVRGLATSMVEAATAAGIKAKFVCDARRSRRLAGTRDARGRCSAAQSFARREIGKSVRHLETEKCHTQRSGRGDLITES